MGGSDSTLSTFTAADGANLAVQHWPADLDRPRRGSVLVVHGLGEHAGRHERVARRLNAWGWDVHGYDQCGHGESDGERGSIPGTARLLGDLEEMIAHARRRTPAGEPLVLLAHSMGALVAGALLLVRPQAVDGVVLSSPAFRVGFGAFQRLLLAVLPRLAPDLTVRNRILPEALSHDPEVVQAYRDDPLVHDRVSARLARFIADTGPRVLAEAPRWPVPTLLLYGAADVVVDPRGSRAFADAAPEGLVRACVFADLRHEVFNELDAEPVYAALRRWLEERFSRPRTAPPAAASPSSAGSSPGW
jgi:alpha-beta hydrolase superfamily lysophospholipase